MQPDLFSSPIQPVASRPHMPGYGILDAGSGQGLLPWSWATERLSQARTYWLSTTRPDDRPHAMPIWGIWLNGAFCFTTGERSRKARNLAARPYAVIGTTSGEDSVVLEGAVWLVDNPSAREAFAVNYSAKYQWNMESFTDALRVIWPAVAYGFSAAANEFSGSATRWTFPTTDQPVPAPAQ